MEKSGRRSSIVHCREEKRKEEIRKTIDDRGNIAVTIPSIHTIATKAYRIHLDNLVYQRLALGG